MNKEMVLPFDVKLEPVRYLQSGDLTCLYQHGKLRYIRFKGREVFRMIYTAIRDENWNTAPYEVKNEVVEVSTHGFNVRYLAHYSMNNIRYEAEVQITANGGEIRMEFKGRALSTFKRNRIGICVLHSVDSILERNVVITKPDGQQYTTVFPKIISPHQPAKDIRVMEWKVDVAEIKIAFEGDVFENEDQRNWTDSSFKTYSTPLDLPMPVVVNNGDIVEQAVEINIKGTGKNPSDVSSAPVETRTPFPAIGFSKPAHKLSEKEIQALKEIPIDHYRVELHISSGDWKILLEEASEEARQFDADLELIVFVSQEFVKELQELIVELRHIHQMVKCITVLDQRTSRSSESILEEANKTIGGTFSSISVGYGVNGHFADLNRNLPAAGNYDFVGFGVTPQAHSTDTMSVLENLDTQRDTIQTIRHHLGNVNIHVSPVTFKGRKPTLFSEGMEPPDFDARQHTAFGAAWVLSMLKNFAGTQVSLFDAAGYKGIVSNEHFTGGPSPLYNILVQLKNFKPEFFVEQEFKNNELVIENHSGERMRIVFDEQYETCRDFRLQQ